MRGAHKSLRWALILYLVLLNALTQLRSLENSGMICFLLDLLYDEQYKNFKKKRI